MCFSVTKPAGGSLLATISLAIVAVSSGCNVLSEAAEPTPRDSSQAPQPNRPKPEPLQQSPASSESDRILLDTASAACRTQDKGGFFSAFATSHAVRDKFTAPEIAYSVRQTSPEYRIVQQDRIPVARYHDFPIRMVDYYYKPTKPVRPGDEDEYVMIEVNQSQSNQLSVEWTRVHFDGPSEGGDDLGTPYTQDGKPYEKDGNSTDGQLLFEWKSDCWQLVADIRNRNGGR